jgi:hypothetical protein
MEPPKPAPGTPAPRRPRRWRRWLLGLLAVTLLAEILLRSVFGFARPLLYQTDPACGYLPKPDQHVRRFFCLNEINSYSMRSPAIQPRRPADTFRLLCIGDSVTYGTTFVPQDQIFTSLLAKSLPAVQHQNVEVLNASAGGWAPANELGFLKSRGTMDANLVLFIWNTGDLNQPFNAFRAIEDLPTENPMTALGEVWSRYVVPRLFRAAAPAPAATASEAEDDLQLAANLECLSQARAIADQAGARLRLLYCASPVPGWYSAQYTRLYQRLVQWTTEQHVPLLDLSSAFPLAAADSLTFDGVHLRPAGHKVVADEISSKWRSLTQSTPAIGP